MLYSFLLNASLNGVSAILLSQHTQRASTIRWYFSGMIWKIGLLGSGGKGMIRILGLHCKHRKNHNALMKGEDGLPSGELPYTSLASSWWTRWEDGFCKPGQRLCQGTERVHVVLRPNKGQLRSSNYSWLHYTITYQGLQAISWRKIDPFSESVRISNCCGVRVSPFTNSAQVKKALELSSQSKPATWREPANTGWGREGTERVLFFIRTL